MNHPYNFDHQAMDMDSMLSLDDDVSMINTFSLCSSTDATVVPPVAMGITQISPYGTNDGMDRYLFAPTPPLIISQNDMNIMSFLSPINIEPVSSCDAHMSSTTFAVSLPKEHRHVTPVPQGTYSPVASLEMTSNSPKDISTTTGGSTKTDAVTSGIAKSHPNKDVALVVSKGPAKVSGKSINGAVAGIIARNEMYEKSILFPVVVHRMIAETCKEYDRSLMHWTACGKYFCINQKHSMLSSIMAKYFNHNRYQSLRRQLNAYGFHKNANEHLKGYWMHPKFCRNSSFEALKAITAARRGQRPKQKKKKKVTKQSKVVTASKTILKKKGKVLKKVVNVSVTGVQSPSIAIDELHKSVLSTEKMCHNSEIKTSHQEDSFANKFYTGDRHGGTLAEDASGKVSNVDIDFLPIEDQFLSDPVSDCNHNLPPFLDDSSSDALNALATVASFLPIATMPWYTPIMKGCDIIQPVPIKQVAISPHRIKMTILADAACWFVPTPIKLPNLSDHCIHCSSLNDRTCCFHDDALSSYSVGSLSSPMKLVLPFCDRSAFTPVISRTDLMMADFCDAFH